jgi:hypothetical protein
MSIAHSQMLPFLSLQRLVCEKCTNCAIPFLRCFVQAEQVMRLKYSGLLTTL